MEGRNRESADRHRKTFAFGIPIVEHIDLEDEEVQALILAPTRELALQIGGELRLLAEQRQGVRVAVLYGGQAMQTQITALKKRPQIVVATPGRLLDHIQRRLVRLDKVRTAVLDEADRMVDMGFIKEVVKIMNLMKSRKNLALLSATISREVMDISWVFQRDPVEITVPEDEENKPDIDQFSINATGMQKVDTLDRIMKNEDYDRAIVFCNTKNMVRRLTGLLQQKKYSVDCIHGDMTQSLREKVMKSFRDGRIRILVATDVAARGLDIDDVDAIFNYDVPAENEHYTHRIGRTGRAKKRGVAYTFVSIRTFPGSKQFQGIPARTLRRCSLTTPES